MKVSILMLFLLSGQNAFALGDPSYNPLNLSPSEYQSVNDMGETTSRMGQWSNERGYQDQQMIDEDPEMMEEEILENKIRDEELMEEAQLPAETIKVNRE